MKNLPHITVLLLLFLNCTAPAGFSQQMREMNFSNLQKDLSDPPAEFRPAPLWVWNTDVTRADIDRMLTEFKEQGFGGVFVHPRPGLITEYLSEEWFALYRHSVETAKDLGLDIWIYDENSYPSGFAGGNVPAQMPRSYDQGIGLYPSAALDLLPNDAEDYFLSLMFDGHKFVDITSCLEDFEGVPGDYYLFNKTYHGNGKWHGGYSYVDLLHPGVTAKFMDITMSGYEKEFGSELGPVIKGIFTDEPQIASPGGFRWTPDLFETFREMWGYDLKEYLPFLIPGEERGPWKKVHHNYMETLTRMFIDRWAKPWFDYCQGKNMIWTGHYWGHGWPDMSHGGDNMAMYAWHQMPGIDMLFNQFNDDDPQAQFGNVRAVKEVRSAANQMGYTRTLCETYGGGGWDETFEDFKRLGDWEYVLGVNFMNQHLSHMTIVGARKYDYPPVFTSLSPWWDNYGLQNDYFARLSMLLSQGEQMNDILVLEPTTTAWLYYSYVGSSPLAMEIGTDFQRFVTRLEKAQVEYDLGSENIIKDHGRVRGGKFVVGQREYGKVIIPPRTENLNAATFALIEDFVASGGQLIAFSIPTLINGEQSNDLAGFFEINCSRIVQPNELTDQTIDEFFTGSVLKFTDICGTGLYHHRRTYNDGELLFLVNSSLTETASAGIVVRGAGMIEIDGPTGDIYSYPFWSNGDFVEAAITLPPAGSIVLFSPAKEGGKYPVRPQTARERLLAPETPLEIHRLRDNALNLDFCDLVIDGVAEKDLYTVEARIRLFDRFGLDDPWNSAIQYRQTIVEKDTFQMGDIRVRYRFTVAGAPDVMRIRLVAEQPSLWKVKINGTPVSAVDGQHWLDTRWGVYEIGGHVREGVNTVELSVSPMSVFAEVSPVYLLGDFSLESAEAGWIVCEPDGKLRPGSWKEQGMSEYSWDVSYGKIYHFDDPHARYSIQLGQWNGTVAEVLVNGFKAGIIYTRPYEFDLTPFVGEGKNKIEVRVVGSLKNIFGPHYSNDVGINGPWHWNGVHRQLPGSRYNLIDYGLMEDFSVFSSR